MFLARAPTLRSCSIRPIRRQTEVFLSSAKKLPSESSTVATAKRFARLQARLPKFVQRYTIPLADAPVTHLSSFIILHEITAVVPLFTLVGIFRYSGWIPVLPGEGKWVADGVERFGNYFRKKGWLGAVGEDGKHLKKRGVWWGRGEQGTRLLVEVGTAWAITKLLLPLRITLSLWATPWFARSIIEPMKNTFAKKIRGFFR